VEYEGFAVATYFYFHEYSFSFEKVDGGSMYTRKRCCYKTNLSPKTLFLVTAATPQDQPENCPSSSSGARGDTPLARTVISSLITTVASYLMVKIILLWGHHTWV
jgi:hypothetical protein